MNPSATPLLSDEADTQWISVDPAYLTALRCHLALFCGAIIVSTLVFSFLIPNDEMKVLLRAGATIALCVFVFLAFVWAPRRVKRTRYLVRTSDINLQKGFMFWKTVSVSFNRIQHLEVNQGPISRAFKLATLSIFTAGTVGSDLKIPGLPFEDAKRIKAQLLYSINAESETDDDPEN